MMILAQTIAIHIWVNIFALAAFGLLFVYFAPRIGSRDANYSHLWIVVMLAVMLFIIGLAPDQIWHLLTAIGHK